MDNLAAAFIGFVAGVITFYAIVSTIIKMTISVEHSQQEKE
jgi:hypothetical protein